MAEVQNRSNTSTPIINYGVSGSKGKIYKSSKKELDGYEKVELQSGGVVFHKYVDGLEGKCTYIAAQESEVTDDKTGKTKKINNLKCFLNDGISTASLSLKTYSKEWKAFIEKIYNFDFDKTMGVSFYYKVNKEDETKKYLSCYVYYAGEETQDAEGKTHRATPEWLVTKDIAPPPVRNKKGEWVWEDNDIWYEEKLTEVINRFKEHKLSAAALSSANNTSVAGDDDGDEDDSDDLPF